MHRGWGAHRIARFTSPAEGHPERGSNLGFHIQYDVSECATDSDREERVQAELAHKSNRSEQVVNPMSIVPPFPQEVGGGASGCEFFAVRVCLTAGTE
jgi:hypothetical protein